MNLPLFIARRIYSGSEADKRRVSRPAVLIATIGIAIGLAVMIVAVSVIVGWCVGTILSVAFHCSGRWKHARKI